MPRFQDKIKTILLALIFINFVSLSFCVAEKLQAGKPEIVWDKNKLFSVPKTYQPPISDAEGVKALFYEGLPYKGKKTRVFAWYGVPDKKTDKPFPAVVCAHGGGGTAFRKWVQIWNRNGYAAIAMDQEGCLPVKKGQNFETKSEQQHKWHGPRRSGVFGDIDKPVEQQWMYHAVADVILAHSLIRSFPEIDSDKIGLTGISWGGIVSSIVMGIDDRFKFSIPVYGCGFLYESQNHYQQSYRKMTAENAEKCRKLWDGSSYLAYAEMPSLWLNGTNDKHFYPTIFQKSYERQSGQVNVSLKPDLKHGHRYGWEPKEIYAFADSIVKDGTKLPQIRFTKCEADFAAVSFKSSLPVKSVKLYYTLDSGKWQARKWLNLDVTGKIDGEKVTSDVPAGVTAYFFSFKDNRDLTVTSKVWFRSE